MIFISTYYTERRAECTFEEGTLWDVRFRREIVHIGPRTLITTFSGLGTAFPCVPAYITTLFTVTSFPRRTVVYTGVRILNYMTAIKPYQQLRVDLRDINGHTSYALYDKFSVTDSLSVGNYRGNAGQSVIDLFDLLHCVSKNHVTLFI